MYRFFSTSFSIFPKITRPHFVYGFMTLCQNSGISTQHFKTFICFIHIRILSSFYCHQVISLLFMFSFFLSTIFKMNAFLLKIKINNAEHLPLARFRLCVLLDALI